MKIAVAGLGYVGLSNAVLLARQHRVIALDITPERVADVNAGRPSVQDADCARFMGSGALDLRATMDPVEAYQDAEIVFVATPTNYDEATHSFDTSSIEAVVRQVQAINPGALMVIKSTVPVGYTLDLRARMGCDSIVFSPEFLREGQALHDNLHPSRIVVGDTGPDGRRVAELLRAAALAPDVPVLLTGPTEAEAIKLFANTYLAMRVAFFNEVDSLAMHHDLNAGELVRALSASPQVGNHYNNPSFGFGGYCLPKDSKQLLANFAQVPQSLISAIVESNEARKTVIAQHILGRNPSVVGIHRLVMKAGSDNFRESSVQGIMARLRAAGVPMVIYEPAHAAPEFDGIPVEHDLDRFKARADLVIANRSSPDLADLGDRLVTRDLFGVN
jgi:UDPglucose 6-dehydrogenase